MLLTTKVIEAIGMLINDPRKIYSDDRSSLGEDPGLSNISKISEIETKRKRLKKKGGARGKNVIYVIIVQREKHRLSQCYQFCPEVNEDRS